MAEDQPEWRAELEDFCWLRLRTAGAKLGPTLANILGDGDYLTAWRGAAAFLLPFVFLLGLFLGKQHFAIEPEGRVLFLYSMPTLAALIGLSQHGAAVGFWAWTGLVLGELWRGFTVPGHSENPLIVIGAWGLVAACAWAVMVATPLISRQLARALNAKLKPKWRSLQGEALLHALLLFAFVFLWCQSAPAMLQQTYVWQKQTPMTHGLYQTLRNTAWAYAGIAAYVGAMRVLFEAAAQRNEAFAAVQDARREAVAAATPPPSLARTLVATVLKAAYLAFLMSTYIPTWISAATVFAVLTAVMLFRAFVLGRLGLGRSIGRIPIAIRLPLSMLCIYGLSYMTVKKFWDADDFVPTLWSTVIAIVIGAVLLPPPASAAAPRKAEA